MSLCKVAGDGSCICWEESVGECRGEMDHLDGRRDPTVMVPDVLLLVEAPVVISVSVGDTGKG